MKNVKSILIIVFIFLLVSGCEQPNSNQLDIIPIQTEDYLNTNSSFSIQYSVITPTNMTFGGSVPTKLWLTYQATTDKIIALISSDIVELNGGHSACVSFTKNSTSTAFNGGSIWGISSIPFQKIHLPSTLSSTDTSIEISEYNEPKKSDSF
jgi:hypothetical protein